MAIKLSDLRSKTRQVQVDYLGDTVTVEYLVNALTMEFLDRDPNAVEQVKEIVSSWDVLDDTGNPIPPGEIADQLPLAFLSAVLEAIVADMRSLQAEKKASSAG